VQLPIILLFNVLSALDGFDSSLGKWKLIIGHREQRGVYLLQTLALKDNHLKILPILRALLPRFDKKKQKTRCPAQIMGFRVAIHRETTCRST
jgi:hypothetical protein